MGDSTSELLEILREPLDADVSRKEYRVRVKGQLGFYLHYQNSALPLADISAGGASVLSREAGELDEGLVLKDCELEVARQSFSGLSCKVMHRSIDGDGSLVCGVQWLELPADITQRLEHLVHALRKQMFRSLARKIPPGFERRS
jgi:c-di-GMP-binding flagellar brake protein YcgR